MKHLISACRCNCKFWAEKWGKIWPKLDLCANISQEASKKNPRSVVLQLCWIFYIFLWLLELYPLPCKCLQSPMRFLLWISAGQFWVGVWKRKYFPSFNPCSGYLFLCDGFPHLAPRCCLFFMSCFISKPELYVPARWLYLRVLWGPPCKLVTIMYMWHCSREEEMGEKSAVTFRLDAEAREGTSGFFNQAVTRKGVISGVTASTIWHSSVLHLGHTLFSPEDTDELKSSGSV